MTNRTLFLIAFLFCNVFAFAQDPHFSQYFTSPLTLNPANTGNFVGPGRLSSNVRSQWLGIGKPYLTGTVSFDTDLFKKRERKADRFSFGAMGLFDKTSGGLLTSNYVSASLGYHIDLDYEGTNSISLGFQGTLANKRLDYTKISFSDQFSSYGFDLTLPSNQSFSTQSITYGDVNVGFMYNYVDEFSSFYFGASAYHLSNPKETFLNNLQNRLPMRLTAHAGGMFDVGLDGTLIASGLLMRQGNINQKMIGLAYGKQLQSALDDIRVFIGAWYRDKDAIIPYAGYIYNNFQFGLSYDINVSGLSAARSRYTSIELSMIYLFLDKSDYKRLVPWY